MISWRHPRTTRKLRYPLRWGAPSGNGRFKIFPEDIKRDVGQDQKNVGSPIDTLVNTVSHMQRDLAILRDENRALRTPATSQVIQAPRRAALTTTKVPRFDGTTSWEQYHQVFEAIVRSNGWDNDTAALQLFSHLEGMR